MPFRKIGPARFVHLKVDEVQLVRIVHRDQDNISEGLPRHLARH